MYEKFFGFRERPFDLVPDPRFLVMIAAHREALSNLEYAIVSRKGMTLLLGEAGLGKTTLVHAAIGTQSKRVHCVYLPNPALTRGEFVEILATKFQLSWGARASKAALLIELEGLVRDRHARGESTVLVVDEAQSLSIELLEEVRLLANFETAAHKLLSVILAGQPELSVRLNDPALRQLKQRVALRCELKPLTLQETATYLAGRIQAAGGQGAQVFTRDAVSLIHERSAGIPRTISVLADNALVSGFALEQRPVGRHIVLDVCRDFDLGQRREAGVDAPAGFPTGEGRTNGRQNELPDPVARPAAALASPRRPSLLMLDQPFPESPRGDEAAAAAGPARRRRLFGIF